MKLLSIITLFGAVASFNASADCLVELTGVNVNPFIERDCREAMKECSKFKRTRNYSHLQCEIVDDNYRPYNNGGNNNGGGYNPPHNTGGNSGYPNDTVGDIIEHFISGFSTNCSVVPYVDGRYHQVYVNGRFKGNYEISSYGQQAELRRVLTSYVRNGQCNYSQYGQSGPSSSSLLSRYTSNFYYNCQVVTERIYGYYQLYINNQFKGNFDPSSPAEMARLNYSLRSYDQNGTCRR